MSFNNFAVNISRKLPPEFSNKFSLSALKFIYNFNLTKILFSLNKNKSSPSNYFGLDFPNKIGVAGGLDKNANYFQINGFGILLNEDQIDDKLFPLLHSMHMDKSILKKIIKKQKNHKDKFVFKKLRNEIKKIFYEN